MVIEPLEDAESAFRERVCAKRGGVGVSPGGWYRSGGLELGCRKQQGKEDDVLDVCEVLGAVDIDGDRSGRSQDCLEDVLTVRGLAGAVVLCSCPFDFAHRELQEV